MTEYQRSRIISESPQHGPVLIAELESAEVEMKDWKDRAYEASSLAAENNRRAEKAEADLAEARKEKDCGSLHHTHFVGPGGCYKCELRSVSVDFQIAQQDRDLALAQLGEAREALKSSEKLRDATYKDFINAREDLREAQSTPCESCGFVLKRPVIGCGHVGGDGCCQHPDNMTPECHYDACPLVLSRTPANEPKE